MARPLRDGVDYFPFDVGALRDSKLRLIKGEFGALGIYVYLYMLCSIYEDNGYYKKWSDDVCILVSEEVGCGCNFKTIAEIVQGLIRRSLFDERVANTFGVLTSAGIQRRYIRAASQRDDIPIIRDYWLLDSDDKKDVPNSILNKITFKSLASNGNPDKTGGNSNKTPDNPQSKVKESKVKYSKEYGAEAPPDPPRRKRGKYGWVKLTDEEYERLITDYGKEAADHYIAYVDESAQQTGNKNRWKDWNLTVRKAIRMRWGGGRQESSPAPKGKPKALNYRQRTYEDGELDHLFASFDNDVDRHNPRIIIEIEETEQC